MVLHQAFCHVDDKGVCTFLSKLNVVHLGLMSQHGFLTKLPCKQDSICKMKMRNSCITGLCKIKPCLHTRMDMHMVIQGYSKNYTSLQLKATNSSINFYVGLKQNVVHGPTDLSMG